MWKMPEAKKNSMDEGGIACGKNKKLEQKVALEPNAGIPRNHE